MFPCFLLFVEALGNIHSVIYTRSILNTYWKCTSSWTQSKLLKRHSMHIMIASMTIHKQSSSQKKNNNSVSIAPWIYMYYSMWSTSQSKQKYVDQIIKIFRWAFNYAITSHWYIFFNSFFYDPISFESFKFIQMNL